jgi:hypothetical protein
MPEKKPQPNDGDVTRPATLTDLVPELLLQMKQRSVRPKDQADAEFLRHLLQ